MWTQTPTQTRGRCLLQLRFSEPRNSQDCQETTQSGMDQTLPHRLQKKKNSPAETVSSDFWPHNCNGIPFLLRFPYFVTAVLETNRATTVVIDKVIYNVSPPCAPNTSHPSRSTFLEGLKEVQEGCLSGSVDS